MGVAAEAPRRNMGVGRGLLQLLEGGSNVGALRSPNPVVGWGCMAILAGTLPCTCMHEVEGPSGSWVGVRGRFGRYHEVERVHQAVSGAPLPRAIHCVDWLSSADSTPVSDVVSYYHPLLRIKTHAVVFITVFSSLDESSFGRWRRTGGGLPFSGYMLHTADPYDEEDKPALGRRTLYADNANDIADQLLQAIAANYSDVLSIFRDFDTDGQCSRTPPHAIYGPLRL